MKTRLLPVLFMSFAGVVLAGCQTVDGQATQLDQDCVQKQVGSRLLAKVAGTALGLTGVPGVGKVGGYAVSYATNPNCNPVKAVAAPRGRRVQAAAPQPQPQPVFRIEPAAPPGR